MTKTKSEAYSMIIYLLEKLLGEPKETEKIVILEMILENLKLLKPSIRE